MTYELLRVATDDDWRRYHEIRRVALFEDRGLYGVYDEDHPDEANPRHHPLLLKFDGAGVGTVRVDELRPGEGAIRLVAIRSGLQRRGHGRKLSQLADGYAWRLDMRTLYVNAAPEALGYYRKMGWTLFDWDPAEIEGIAGECIQMRKELSQYHPSTI